MISKKEMISEKVIELLGKSIEAEDKETVRKELRKELKRTADLLKPMMEKSEECRHIVLDYVNQLETMSNSYNMEKMEQYQQEIIKELINFYQTMKS